tara:strand:+ start:472 stop:795 length:324 start_codon:yes stop_codon:yes gene_type:complete
MVDSIYHHIVHILPNTTLTIILADAAEYMGFGMTLIKKEVGCPAEIYQFHGNDAESCLFQYVEHRKEQAQGIVERMQKDGSFNKSDIAPYIRLASFANPYVNSKGNN